MSGFWEAEVEATIKATIGVWADTEDEAREALTEDDTEVSYQLQGGQFELIDYQVGEVKPDTVLRQRKEKASD
jgi:hypothetical protein